MSERIRELVIRDERSDSGYNTLHVKIGDDGSLVLEGVDAGPEVERMFGDWGFEYWLTINAEDKDSVLLHLIQSRFSSVHAFRVWLAERGIESGFQSF